MTHIPQRPRRNRAGPWIRSAMQETRLDASHLVLPLFFHDKDAPSEPISAMPGCMRHNMAGLVTEVLEAASEGIGAVVLFPAVPSTLKTLNADECYNPDGMVPKAIKRIKSEVPHMIVMTDVALDPYSSDGHDGLVSRADKVILNDETVKVLVKQALCHARAGADVIAPSDMMDGRVAAIRKGLDTEGFTRVSILSYTAKYASSFYGPFRTALDSAPREDAEVPSNKKTYQMDPANGREALRELALDEAEGADMVMVKPGGPFLDVIFRLRQNTNLPVAAYQVSGEYCMLKAAAQQGWLEERASVMESLLGLRRAGADIIFTYYARQAARWLVDDRRK